MAVSSIAAQSDAISSFRSTVGAALDNLAQLQGNLLRVAALGGFDAFAAGPSGAFQGTNGDIAAADLDAANLAVQAILAVLYGSPGVPTTGLLALAKVALPN
jgi:hypothetical protein